MAFQKLMYATIELSKKLDELTFSEPVTHVYNPLVYAWEPHRLYLEKYCTSPKKILFLGMNPGPFGMAQTGVPFGEINSVRDWLGIRGEVLEPKHMSPKRPVLGFNCKRSEVSGLRLWGFFKEKFNTPEAFAEKHYVHNYCPLLFSQIEEKNGRTTCKNLTPDNLPADQVRPLYEFCDDYLRLLVGYLQPAWLIGVGTFARARLKYVFPDGYNIGQILHPSPASPLANKGFSEIAEKQLREMGAWE